MTRNEAIESLKSQPLDYIELPRLDEGKVFNNRFLYRGKVIGLSASSGIQSFFGIRPPYRLSEADKRFWEEDRINSKIAEHGDMSVVVTVQNNRLVSIRRANTPFISNLDILLNTNFPDDADFTLNGTTLTIRAFTDLEIEAKEGDPVKVGIEVKNNESGRRPSFRFNTSLLRLICTNGATMESSMFSAHYAGKDIQFLDQQIGTFVNDLNNNARLIADSIQRMVTLPLGTAFSRLKKNHERLLGHTNHDPYDSRSTYWTFWNSVTESAKLSPNRMKLESAAGRLVERFTNA